MKSKVVLFLTCAAFLGACAKSNSTVDSAGLCTQSMVDDYNDVQKALECSSRTSSSSYSSYSYYSGCYSVTDVSSACSKFKSNHATGQSCKARSRATYAEMQVNTTSVHQSCDSYAVTAASKATTTTSTTTPVSKISTTADSDGDCTPAFRADYNNFTNASEEYSNCDSVTRPSVCRERKERVLSYCSIFKSQYKREDSCKAYSRKIYSNTTVYPGDVIDQCKKLSEENDKKEEKKQEKSVVSS